MAARRASALSTVTSPVRKAKKWAKEAVMGIVGTAVVAGLLAAFGINGNNPFTADPNTPQGKLERVVEKAAIKAKERVAEAAKNGKLPTLESLEKAAVEGAQASFNSDTTSKFGTGASTSSNFGTGTNTSSSTTSGFKPNNANGISGSFASTGGANAGAASAILGNWEQLVYNPANSQWYSGGIFQVAKSQQSYTLAMMDYSQPTPRFVVVPTITDIAFSNDEWTFNSKIDQTETLSFKLRRVDAQTFQGYCYQNGQQVAANTWRRVQ